MSNELEKRNNIAKWFLILSTIIVVITLIASVPALDELTDSFLTKAIEEKLVITCMFFMPLSAIFVLLPIVKLQNRSLLLWGIGFVLFPLGTIVWGWVLYFLSKKALSSVAT